jgi:NADH-quinone oxidoreductase subunit F
MPKTELKEYIVMRHREIPNLADIEVYMQHGGYAQARRAVTELQPQQVADEVKASGLRGRGGAGFPTGVKWGFVPKDIFPKYLICNADESEPGTFNNHEIILQNPHQMLEGMILAGFALGANVSYIYIRGEFAYLARLLDQKLAELRARGFLGQGIFGSQFNFDIHVHRGAGAYICGEETALLESLEGKIGQPRLKPPFPAVAGLYAKPTVVNNVETLANVPRIIEKGAAWFRTMGTEKSPGTKVISISGHVKNPGNYEIPLGITMREFIYDWAGGMRSEQDIKLIIPGGASSNWLTREHLDIPLTWDDMAAKGRELGVPQLMLGSGAVVVLDESVCVVQVAMKVDEFFKHESCGKCSPCREGTYFLVNVWDRIASGHGRANDIPLLSDLGRQMHGKCFCPLGDSAVSPVASALQFFKDEIQAHIDLGRCPLGFKHVLPHHTHARPVETGQAGEVVHGQ